MVIKIKKSGIIAAAALLPANELRLCACVHANTGDVCATTTATS